MFRFPLMMWALAAAVAPVLGDEPAKSKAGPFAVATVDHSLKDDARKKELACQIHHPTTGGPHPVILFSHGFAGNKDSFAVIGKHWASHGYVVVHPTHADGQGRRKANSDKTSDNAPAARTRPGGLLGGLSDPAAIAGRVADLVLILDRLEDLPKAVPGLQGRIDAKAIGVGGHSLGAYTAMLIGGVTADLGADKNKSFLDKRIKCLLPISAQGAGQQGLTNRSWNALTLPMMTVTGTRDQGAGGQGVDWKKEPFKHSPPGNKYLVVIEGANHLSFGGGPGARGGTITDAVKLSTTYYWDAYLKDADGAKQYLQSDRLAKDSGGAMVVERK